MWWQPLLAAAAQVQASVINITPPAGAVGLSGSGPTLGLKVRLESVNGLAFQGQVPGVTNGLSIPAGALAFTGFAPSVLTAIKPATGALGFTGQRPTVFGPQTLPRNDEYLARLFKRKRFRGAAIFDHYTAGGAGAYVTVPAGALGFGGVPPTSPPQNFGISSPEGTLAFTGAAVTLGLRIVPPAGALALAGLVPASVGATPAPAGLAFAGSAPTVVQNAVRVTQVGALGFAGAAPPVSRSIAPPVGALAFNGLSPTIPRVGILPTQGAFALTGAAPVLGVSITPPVGSLGLAGAPPPLGVGVNPRAGALALVGRAPFGFGFVPPEGALAFTGAAPRLALGITVRSGALAFTGVGAVLNPTGQPTTGALAFTGYPPLVGAQGAPAATTLALAGAAPGITVTTPKVPPNAALGLTGRVPQFDYGLVPGAGALGFAGQQAFSSVVVTPNEGTLGFTGGTPLVTVLAVPVPRVVPPIPAPPIPALLPEPAYDLALDELFQSAVAGILGFDPTLVRPLWQLVPPTEPPIDVDWVAVGSNIETGVDYPVILAQGPNLITNDLGSVLEIELERIEVLVVFYGPNAQKFAARLRDGIAVPQNMEPLQSVGIYYTDRGPARTVPELINQQWRRRCDVLFTFSRAVTRRYGIANVAVTAIHLIDDTGHLDRTIPVPPPVN